MAIFSANAKMVLMVTNVKILKVSSLKEVFEKMHKKYISDENPISVTVTEPKIKILQVGESVTLRCNVQTGGQVSILKQSNWDTFRIHFPF